MDVGRGHHGLHHGHLLAVDEVAAVLAKHERHDALVRSTVARLQAEQADGLEVGSVHGAHRRWIALDRIDKVLDVVGVARLVRAAVHLAEDPAPEPLAKDVLVSLELELVAPDVRTGRSERYDLRRVGQVAFAENALTEQELACYVESFEQVVEVRLVVLKLEVEHVLLLAARVPLVEHSLCKESAVKRH